MPTLTFSIFWNANLTVQKHQCTLCVCSCVVVCVCVSMWAGLRMAFETSALFFIITTSSSSPSSYQGPVHHHHLFIITIIISRSCSSSQSLPHHHLHGSAWDQHHHHHHLCHHQLPEKVFVIIIKISISVSINISPASEFHSHFAWAPQSPKQIALGDDDPLLMLVFWREFCSTKGQPDTSWFPLAAIRVAQGARHCLAQGTRYSPRHAS